jgi:2-methylisocitrate lyase-like PEP mutase family enzyme
VIEPRRRCGPRAAGRTTVSAVTSSASPADRAAELLRLHTEPELLVVVNVWDAISARVVADQPGSRALATASHSIAATLGYPDGEQIPVDLMIDMVGRIAAAVDLPVSADLEGGYGAAGETVRKAIGVGVVGANLEDRMRPLADATAVVAAAVKAGEAEGVPFVLNARTDAFHRDRGEVLADAIERGRAFLDAGAACVFVPGKLDEATVLALVEGIGERRVSVIAVPGSLPQSRLAELGVARVSFGPWTQRSALTHLAGLTRDLLAGGRLPEDVQPLN